jgi:collagenase-like PrtC family protease
MSTWVIPYVDQDLSFWEEIADRFGTHVKEVYFPIPGGTVASGRPKQPAQFIEPFLRYARLPKAVLVNPIVLDRPVEEIAPRVIEALKQLQDEFGVSSVTVANLTLAQLIREECPELRITASVLMGIARPSQVLMVRDYVDAITPDNSLVRNMNGLRQLREAFAGEIRLIVNEACIPGCLYRTQHFYEMGYGDFYPQSLCQQMLDEHPWLRLTGAWILPRHLVYYEGLCDSLKLAGRVTLRDRARYLTVLSAYVHREEILPRDIGGGPASVLEAIDIADELFEFILSCDKNCHACSVCRDYYELAVAEREVAHYRRERK